MNVLELLRVGPVIPVIVIDDLSHALPLAKALVRITALAREAAALRPRAN